MTLHKTYAGLNEDGTPHFDYVNDDPSVPVVVTGPIYGSVTLDDGTEVDVNEAVIEVPCEGHPAPGQVHKGKMLEHGPSFAAALKAHQPECRAEQVAHLIGLRHEAEGHPLHRADPTAPPFRHVPPAWMKPAKSKASS